jgi:predicted double-glycine peptidase
MRSYNYEEDACRLMGSIILMQRRFLTMVAAFGLALSGCVAPVAERSPALSELIRVPLTRQATDHTCSVASLQSVLAYYGDGIREDLLASALGTTDDGTPKEAMAAYARRKEYEVHMHFDTTLEELQRVLDQGKPALVSLQAWRAAPVDYRDDWDDGHWAVAVGYDQERIYFMDPSTLGNYTFIPTGEFLDRWHDADMDGETELNHFMMVVAKRRPTYHPEAISRME